jgi:hypothetical protein
MARPKTSKRKNNKHNNNSHSSSASAPFAAIANFRKLVTCAVPRGLQLFPDIFVAHAKTVIALGLSGSVASQHTFHINSPANLFGPQVNWTGSFVDNVPAGMYYLLSSNAAAGSRSPYLYVCTTDIDYEVELTNIQSIAAYVTVIPSIEASYSGMSQSQLAEQRGAMQVLVQDHNNTMTTKLKGRYAVHEILGTTRHEVVTNANYKQTVGALPPLSAYLHFICASVDGATTVAMQAKHTFTMTHRFTAINTFVTTVPT